MYKNTLGNLILQ